MGKHNIYFVISTSLIEYFDFEGNIFCIFFVQSNNNANARNENTYPWNPKVSLVK